MINRAFSLTCSQFPFCSLVLWVGSQVDQSSGLHTGIWLSFPRASKSAKIIIKITFIDSNITWKVVPAFSPPSPSRKGFKLEGWELPHGATVHFVKDCPGGYRIINLPLQKLNYRYFLKLHILIIIIIILVINIIIIIKLET